MLCKLQQSGGKRKIVTSHRRDNPVNKRGGSDLYWHTNSLTTIMLRAIRKRMTIDLQVHVDIPKFHISLQTLVSKCIIIILLLLNQLAYASRCNLWIV